MSDNEENSSKEIELRSDVFDLAPSWIVEKMKAVDQRQMSLSERALERMVLPSLEDDSLRVRFWVEYAVAVEEGRKMRMENVYAGTCTKGRFIEILKNKHKCLWIFKPPLSYTTMMEALSAKALRRLDQVLDMELTKVNSQGDIVADGNLIGRVIKVFELVDNRIRGMAKQVVESKNLSVTIEEKRVSPSSMDELEKKLERLKEQALASGVLEYPEDPVKDVRGFEDVKE